MKCSLLQSDDSILVTNKFNPTSKQFMCLTQSNSHLNYVLNSTARPRSYKTFSCSTQLSKKFILLINVKMHTIVGILTFISMIITSERLKQEASSFDGILVFMSS